LDAHDEAAGVGREGLAFKRFIVGLIVGFPGSRTAMTEDPDELVGVIGTPGMFDFKPHFFAQGFHFSFPEIDPLIHRFVFDGIDSQLGWHSPPRMDIIVDTYERRPGRFGASRRFYKMER